jgi:hypothetical protein
MTLNSSMTMMIIIIILERENPDRIYFKDPQLRVFGKDTMLIKTYILVHKPHLELLKQLCNIGY